MKAAVPESVRLEGVSRLYGSVPAVDRLDLVIYEGEFFSIIGPSGCGKTTTLRMVAGLETVTTGGIFVGGRDVTKLPPHKRPVNTVFQQYALFPHMDVYENVAFGLRERKQSKTEIDSAVREMLDLVNLTGRERATPRELSGGQQQRVALARALVLNPSVLLLDEPLGALDLKLRRQMQSVLKRIQRETEVTFIYVTHDQEEAFSMSDRVAVMNHGLIEHIGRPAEVYSRPRTLFVADFVGASNGLRGLVVRQLVDESYMVKLEMVDEPVTVNGVAGLAEGDKVLALLRPEAALLHAGEAAEVQVAGTIQESAYFGPQVTYRCTLSDGSDVRVTCKPDTRTGPLPLGTTLTAAWEPADVWLLPAPPRDDSRHAELEPEADVSIPHESIAEK
jgi:spermidine/putrescine transport system ATP-binding protein